MPNQLNISKNPLKSNFCQEWEKDYAEVLYLKPKEPPQNELKIMQKDRILTPFNGIPQNGFLCKSTKCKKCKLP